MSTTAKLSTAARREILLLLTEAKRLAISRWTRDHMAAFCAAMRARLYDLIDEVKDAVRTIKDDTIARWGADKRVQERRDALLAMA